MTALVIALVAVLMTVSSPKGSREGMGRHSRAFGMEWSATYVGGNRAEMAVKSGRLRLLLAVCALPDSASEQESMASVCVYPENLPAVSSLRASHGPTIKPSCGPYLREQRNFASITQYSVHTAHDCCLKP